MRKDSLITNKFFTMLGGGTMFSIVSSLIVLSDTIIAGLFLGDHAVVAINLVTPIYGLSWFFASLITLGSTTIYTRELGAFHEDEADRVFANGLFLSVLIGIMLFLFFQLLGRPYLAFYNPAGEEFDLALKYMFWMSLVMLVSPLGYYINRMVFTDGDEGLNTVANLASALGNVILSIFLCQKVGIVGIGIGSFGGALLGLIVHLLHFLKKSNSLKPGFGFYGRIALSASKYGFPEAADYLFLAVFQASVTKGITMLFGSKMLILASVILVVKEAELFFDGIGETITPIIGAYLAEDSYAAVKKVWKLAEKVAVAEGAVAALFIILLSGRIPLVLGINDALTRQIASTGLCIMAFEMVFISLLYLASSYYLVQGRIGLVFFINMFMDMLSPIVFMALLGKVFGLYGIFAGITVAGAVNYAGMRLYIRQRYGKENDPLMNYDKEKNIYSEVYEFPVTPADIVRTRDSMEEVLTQSGVSVKVIFRTMRLFEELFMMVYDHNEGRKVLGECSLMITDDKITLITRNNGKEMNLAEYDNKVSSFRQYSLNQLITTRNYAGKDLSMMSFNRTMFEFER